MNLLTWLRAKQFALLPMAWRISAAFKVIALSFILVLSSAPASASVSCGITSVSLGTAQTRLTVYMGEPAGTNLDTRSMSVTLTCNGNETTPSGDTFYLGTGAGTFVPYQNIVLTNTPATTSYTSGCPARTGTVSEGKNSSTFNLSWGVGTVFTNCVITASWTQMVQLSGPVTTTTTGWLDNQFDYNECGVNTRMVGAFRYCFKSSVAGSAAVIYGAITSNTISLNIIGCTLTTSVMTVTLPTVSQKSLRAGGGFIAGTTPFNVSFTGCTTQGVPFGVSGTWSFTQANSDPTLLSNTATSPASNVYVQLVSPSGTIIQNGAQVSMGTVSTDGAATFKHFARYYSIGAPGTGNVKGTATFTLNYQ